MAPVVICPDGIIDQLVSARSKTIICPLITLVLYYAARGSAISAKTLYTSQTQESKVMPEQDKKTDEGKAIELESELISDLRQEVRELKDCFARYSFQGVGLSAAVLAIISRYQQEFPYVGLSAIPVVVMLIALARMGAHKYTSVNRNCGYELHLQRTRRLPDSGENVWKKEWRDLGWEEAMRAWRIVQATVYRYVYKPGEWKLENLPKDWRGRKDLWFQTADNVSSAGGEAVYYSGSYLKTSLEIIYVVIVLSFIPPIVTVGQLYLKQGVGFRTAVISLFTLATALLCVLKIRKIERRRVVLEEGLLSIHSCAIMWHAVVVAHFRAVADPEEKTERIDGSKYMHNLAVEALDLRKNIEDIYDWIEGKCITPK